MRVLPGEIYASSSDEEAPETEDIENRPPIRVDPGHAVGTVRRRMRTLRTGDFVDVREEDVWYPAQVKKVDSQLRKIYVSFSPQEPNLDKWIQVNSATVAPLYTHTYDERGNFRNGQIIEVCDERGVWRGAVIVDIHQYMVKVQFLNVNNHEEAWINSPEKRIRTLRRGTQNHFKRWKIPGVNNHTNSSIVQRSAVISTSSATDSVTSHDYYDNQDEDDHRTRQIVAYSDRYSHYVHILENQGLTVVPVSGDGNCLFRSVAHQVYGDDELHWLVREKCMAYMEADSTFFSQFVEGGMECFHLYLAAKRRNGCWGDDPEIQAICEIYGRRAEIWAYDATVGAKKLRTFHEVSPSGSAIETRAPTIMLSYYGGGHYDSIVSRYHSVNLMHSNPGVVEDAAINRVRTSTRDTIGPTREELSVVGSDSSGVATTRTAAASSSSSSDGIADAAALDLSIQLSRNGVLDWASEDLDACLSIAMNDNMKKRESSSNKSDIPDDFNNQNSLVSAAIDISSAQRDILKSVTEQSEREYLDRAIMKSLADDSNVTEEDILEIAKKASMGEAAESVQAENEMLEMALKDSMNFMVPPVAATSAMTSAEDHSLDLALKLSMMSEDEALAYALEQSKAGIHTMGSGNAAIPLGNDYLYNGTVFGAVDTEDDLLQAALTASLMSGPTGNYTGTSYSNSQSASSAAAASIPSANTSAALMPNAPCEPTSEYLDFDDDEDLKLAISESLMPRK